MDKIKIAAGESKDVWFGFNVQGRIFYAIRTENGENRARFWWIKWGFGGVGEIGQLIGEGNLRIPINVYRGVAAAKLRGNADVNTIVYISDEVAVDASVSFDW